MNSNTYCSLWHALKRNKHRSKGFRESEPHNLLAGLHWFSCTALSDETKYTTRGKSTFCLTFEIIIFLMFPISRIYSERPQSQQLRAGISPTDFSLQSYQHSRKMPAIPSLEAEGILVPHNILAHHTFPHTNLFYNGETRSSFHFKMWQSEEQSNSFQQT